MWLKISATLLFSRSFTIKSIVIVSYLFTSQYPLLIYNTKLVAKIGEWFSGVYNQIDSCRLTIFIVIYTITLNSRYNQVVNYAF
jgi:hypothetical protein